MTSVLFCFFFFMWHFFLQFIVFFRQTGECGRCERRYSSASSPSSSLAPAAFCFDAVFTRLYPYIFFFCFFDGRNTMCSGMWTRYVCRFGVFVDMPRLEKRINSIWCMWRHLNDTYETKNDKRRLTIKKQKK